MVETADITEAVDEALSSIIFGTTGVCFFIQCGFAMVESGFADGENFGKT